MQTFKKAIVCLGGVSAKIEKRTEIIKAFRYALSTLHIPMEIYEEHQNGFRQLYNDMNQDDVLYIINDSAPYHLCEKPNILITRWPLWVQAMPKETTIGSFIQDVIPSSIPEIISCIARNKPMRQPFDGMAPKIYLLVSDYTAKDSSAIGRNGFASFTWSKLIENDIHSEMVFHTSEEWPMINKVVKEGTELFSHPDDILIFMNRDICLIPEATTIIRNHMDTHNISECYSQRIDINTIQVLMYSDLVGKNHYCGIDLFAFRAESKVLPKLLDVDFELGRPLFDGFWAYRIKNKLPYNVCYHLPHASEWEKDGFRAGNKFNLLQLEKHSTKDDLSIEQHYEYFSSPE
jgi:hypothetical protein